MRTASRRYLPRRLHASQPLDSGPRLHIRSREPEQTAQLLHRHLLREMVAARYALYDRHHGVALCSSGTGNGTCCRACLRICHQDLARVWRRSAVTRDTGVCATMVCQAGRKYHAERRRHGFQCQDACTKWSTETSGQWCQLERTRTR